MDQYKESLVAINYELREQRQKEETLLYEDAFWKKAAGKYTAGWKEKISNRIPEKLEATLVKAFTAAFKVVFQEGKIVIQKTYDEDTLRQEYAEKRVGIQTKGDRLFLKRLQKKADKRRLKTVGVAATEGVGLGILGIGLPDIPILIGNMIRTCTVAAQSHGINTDRMDEQVYMLRLIRLVATPVDERRARSEALDIMGDAIDKGSTGTFDLDGEIQLTAEQLAMTMLFSRFVMGLPVVGVAGGLYNPVVVSKLHQLAEIKYESRLLERCKNDLVRQYHK